MEKTTSSKEYQGVERERTLSRLIIILLLIASSVMIVQGFYNLSNLNKVDDSIVTVYEVSSTMDDLARNVLDPITDIRLLSNQLVLSPNKAIARKTEADLDKTIARVEESLGRIGSAIEQTEALQSYQQNFQAIELAWGDYRRALEVTKKYQKSGVRVAAFLSVTKEEKVVYDRLLESIRFFSKSLIDQTSELFEAADKNSDTAFIILLITVIIEVLLLKFILYCVWRMFKSFIQASNTHQEALNQQRQQLEETLDASPVCVGVTVDSKLEYVNKPLATMLGVSVGEDTNQLYVDANQRHQLMQRLEQEDVVSNVEMQFYNKDGEVIDMLNTFYRTEYNSKPAILAWLIDVTELKVIERKHLEAKQLAEEATETKSEFLANMSHEIRTPMNSIIGMSNLALQSNLEPKQKNYIEKVHRSGELLLNIINDILDFSKIEAGKLDLEQVPFGLDSVLYNLVNVLGLQAEEKGLELLFDIPADLPNELMGDGLRLGQVLLNLGNNAIKFTQQGEVVVAIQLLDQTADSADMRFSVRDTGIGMTEQQQAALFQPFSQADSSTTRQFGGTGLGLTICQRLVELMGGVIKVESSLDQGACFSFDITLNKNTSVQTADKLPPSDITGLKVLVVDDNVSSREILVTMMVSYGFKVSACDSGEAAIARVRDHGDKGAYDLVIMDWKMPGIDGIETARQIQQQQLPNTPTCIMVTAYGKDEAISAAEGVAINAFLTKPVTPSTLLDTILQAVGKATDVVPEQSRVVVDLSRWVDQLAGARVLLVEDNDLNQEVAVELLTLNGIQVDVAENGQQAIEKVNQQAYDGVLMDCQMPIMDGYLATAKIRDNPSFAELPILAMTANAMAGDREKALAAGMNDHIAKPIIPDTMFRTMAEWIKPANKGGSDIPTPITQSTTPVNFQGLSTLNIATALIHVNNNDTLLQNLLERFANRYSRFKTDFKAAQVDPDQTAATLYAHTLGSAAGTIGAGAIQDKAKALEALCKTDAGIADQAELVSQIAEDLQLLIAEINDWQQTGETAQGKALSAMEITQALQAIQRLVKESDSEALNLANRLTQSELPNDLAESVAGICEALEQFDFEAAADQLNQLL